MLNITVMQGILANEPILDVTANGTSACRFLLLVDRNGDKNKMKGKTVDYFNCNCYGSLADSVANNLHKGSQTIVVGTFRNENYENWKRETVYVQNLVVSTMYFLPKAIKARLADEFLEEYPEIKKLYNKFVKAQKKKEEEETEQ